MHFISKSIYPLALTVITLSLHAEPRTFTSPDGRKLQAEILSATPDMVTLKLANGQSLAAPINKFISEDQAFIAEWRKANPAAIKYSFSASFTKDKRDSSKRYQNNHEIITDIWLCNIKLANRSGQTLEGLKMDYEIYYTAISGNQAVTRKVTGNSSVENLKHLQETTLKTKEIKLETSKLEGGYYYNDGSRSRQKDSIEGVSIKVTHDGKDVFQWASAGVPKNRAIAEETSAR